MPDNLPRGLVFYGRPLTPRQRMRRRAFLVLLFVATLALVWPGYAPFAGTFPLVLGLPLSLAWPIGWLFLVMGGLLWLYHSDHLAADAKTDTER